MTTCNLCGNPWANHGTACPPVVKADKPPATVWIPDRMLKAADYPADGVLPNCGWQVLPSWVVDFLIYSGFDRYKPVSVNHGHATQATYFNQ
jgi:hypothetical protein